MLDTECNRYCNNKSLAILAALFVANFVFGCGRVKEGFEEAMKAPEDLLKDAAKAASKAGEALSMQEGAEGQVQACTAIVGDLLNTSAACDAAKVGGASDGAACSYTAAVLAVVLLETPSHNDEANALLLMEPGLLQCLLVVAPAPSTPSQ